MHSIFTRSILAAALVFAGARCVVALCVIALGSATAFAQSRTAPENAAAGTSVPGTPAPEAPAPDASRGGIDGLPDAVTVLDILTRLPRRPGSDPATANDGPPDGGPKPRGKTPGTVADAPPRPSRVVNLDPARPFVPRPSPRAAGAPPVITGAVVPQIRDREVIVTLAANATDATVSELGQDLGLDGDTLYASNLLGARVVLFRIPDTRSVADVLQQLAGDARVQLAQPNYVFSASGAAEQPLPVPQYAPKAINLDEAHRTAGGAADRDPVGHHDLRRAGRHKTGSRGTWHGHCGHRQRAQSPDRRRAGSQHPQRAGVCGGGEQFGAVAYACYSQESGLVRAKQRTHRQYELRRAE